MTQQITEREPAIVFTGRAETRIRSQRGVYHLYADGTWEFKPYEIGAVLIPAPQSDTGAGVEKT